MSNSASDAIDAKVCYDKARVISELMFSAMIRMSPLMRLDIECDTLLLLSPDSRSVLSLNTAVDIFELFGFSGVPW